MTAPKLRFKEFDGDWIKVDIQTLVDEKIIDKPMDGNHGEIHPTSADYVEDGIPFVMATDVIDGKVHLDRSKKIKKTQADSLRKGFSLEGDILLTHKATIGNVAKVPELKTPYIILTPQVTYYRILNRDRLTSDFIKSTFEAPFFQNELLALCTGATRLYIGISEQRKLPFSYPSIKEQTKIATFLSVVDEKISQLTQKHQLLSQYKQGMMQKLFSQQIRFKADDGSEFGEWEDKRISEIASYRRGSFPQPYGLPEWLNENGFPFVQVYDVADNMLLKDKTKIKISQLAANQSVFAKTGTLIITLQGSIGRVAKMQYDAYVDRTLLIFQSYSMPINTDYFKYALYLLFNIEKEKADGGIIKTITKETLSKFNIGIPCLEEQTKIANFLSAMDQKIEVVAQQIEQAKQWKKGLLQQMFV